LFSLVANPLTRATAANCPTITYGPVPFPTKTIPAVAFNYPNCAATGNFNRDKYLDLVFCGGAAVYVLFGDTNGPFRDASNAVATAASSIAVADLNNDGNQDLVLGTGGGAAVALGTTNGIFRPPVTYPASVSSPGASEAVVADLDFDGKLDI